MKFPLLNPWLSLTIFDLASILAFYTPSWCTGFEPGPIRLPNIQGVPPHCLAFMGGGGDCSRGSHNRPLPFQVIALSALNPCRRYGCARHPAPWWTHSELSDEVCSYLLTKPHQGQLLYQSLLLFHINPLPICQALLGAFLSAVLPHLACRSLSLAALCSP
jgi:hypothetical protein